MFHTNRRYGSPDALRAYLAGFTIQDAARQLRRHPRTIRDWLTGKRRIPWWTVELLELRHRAALQDLRHMGIRPGPYQRAPTTSKITTATTHATTATTSRTRAGSSPDGDGEVLAELGPRANAR